MDHIGTTRGLTTLSPILPERLRALTNRLRVVRYTPGLGRPLLELSFIHYARWLILDWLPAPSDRDERAPPRRGGRRGLRWKYLLFESNYDRDEEDYLRTFADIVPARLAKLWGACVGFETNVQHAPGAKGRILAPFAFREFVTRNQLEILDFYAAYPESTATDVRQAILMDYLIARAFGERDGTDAALRRMKAVAPMALGPDTARLTPAERLQALGDPWKRALRGRYGVTPLTVAAPVTPEAIKALRCASPQTSRLKPLCSTDTHFARLSTIPVRMADMGQLNPDVLDQPYLLFTSDLSGHPYDYIETLRTELGDTVDMMWESVGDYPGHTHATRFHAWVNSHTLPTRYYLAGYPPRTVSEIKQYLTQREQIAGQYADEPYPETSRLLADMVSARD